MEDNQPILQPLLSSTTTANAATATTVDIPSTPFPPIPSSTTEPEDILDSNTRIKYSSSSRSSSTLGIILRVALVLSIGIISIWANHEASKGFSISTVNEAPDKLPGRRFDLFYVSNDGASRLLLATSKFAENFLYPNVSYPKKQVGHVILRLSSRNLSQPVIVDSGEVHDQFVIHISPSILEETNFKHAMFVAVQHGMVHLWLWDDGFGGNAPANLVDGIVEYVSELAISGDTPEFGSDIDLDGHCWKGKNAKAVARFLNYWELKIPGFIQRLNRGMRNEWHDRMVDDALGTPVQHLCDALDSSRKNSSYI